MAHPRHDDEDAAASAEKRKTANAQLEEGKPIETDVSVVKPTQAEPTSSKLDEWGYRPGSLKSRAAEMYAREQGATLEEVKSALNSVQLNLLKDLEGRGFPVRREKEDGKGGRKVTRYFLGHKE
ncbi:MAG TPA: hypothetical protein VFR24_27655 [Candidatus Angelobacter sp.]|nr:hypothetical protein [Candidatus Angelobacter sp.]